MAYHDEFWVVIGTAAPVLALTNSLAIGSTLTVAGGFFRNVRSASPTPRGRDQRFDLRSRWLLRAYLSAAVGFFVNLGLAGISLTCLGLEEDLIRPLVVAPAVGISFVLILLQVVLATIGELRSGC